jgi:hypothetical protein
MYKLIDFSKFDFFFIGALLGAIAAVFIVIAMNQMNIAFQLKALSCHESVSTGVNSYICYTDFKS